MMQWLGTVNPDVLLVFTGGVLAFLTQFAALIYRIGRAEAAINQRITDVEHGYELEIQKLRNEIIKSKLDIAEAFLKKETFNGFIANLDARLIRLEGKLDKAISHG